MCEKSWTQLREELKMLPRQMCVTPVAEALEYVDEILKLQEQLQSAHQEIERLREELNAYKPSAEVFYERLQRLVRDRDKLIEVLRWYADEDTHMIKRRSDGDYAPIVLDHGKRARDILKECGVTVE